MASCEYVVIIFIFLSDGYFSICWTNCHWAIPYLCDQSFYLYCFLASSSLLFILFIISDQGVSLLRRHPIIRVSIFRWRILRLSSFALRTGNASNTYRITRLIYASKNLSLFFNDTFLLRSIFLCLWKAAHTYFL